MARVSGPLFSLSASGTVGKAFTFGTWKGIPYVREWFKPQNPNTALQQNVRSAMSWCVASWQNVLTQQQKDAYEVGASGKGYSGFNLATSRAMKVYVSDPGTAVPPTNLEVTGDYPSDVIVWNGV